MPLCSKGFVIYDDDDFANIYLNARYNRETNVQSTKHELKHIVNDDIHNTDDIRTIEARADGHAAVLKAVPTLKKAIDLLPPPPPEKQREKPVPLSPRQSAVVLHALSELDRFLFSDTQYFD